jgi:predicted metal-binding protein
MGRLADGLERLGIDARSDFVIAGTVCMAGCDRPCTIAFQASGKATYLFGDIEPDADIDALVAFAELYVGLPDGMTREGQRPAGLRGKTLARIPAAVLISETAGELIQ